MNWLYLERDYGPDIFIGPFSEPEAADIYTASIQVDSLCEEDCLELYVVDEAGKVKMTTQMDTDGEPWETHTVVDWLDARDRWLDARDRAAARATASQMAKKEA